MLIGAVATARYVHRSESHRAWMRILGVIPWEAGLLLLAYLAWRGLRGGGALVEDPGLGIQRPSLLIIAFPLILLAAAGVVGARLFAASARWIRGRSGGFHPSAYLAVHRLAGGGRLALALVAGSALALGVLVQSQTLVRSLETTVHAKARVYVGSDAQLRVDYHSQSPDGLDFPLTRVVRYPAAGALSSGGPSTCSPWTMRRSPQPLTGTMRSLGRLWPRSPSGSACRRAPRFPSCLPGEPRRP